MRVFLRACMLPFFLLIATAGCASNQFMTADDFCRAIYDMNVQEQALNEGFPANGLNADTPSYDQYRFMVRQNPFQGQ